MFDSQLTGPMLDYLGNMTALATLAIADNEFDGSFPTTFVEDHPNLANLDVSRNKFTGPIPLGFENLRFLTEVQLAGNQFNGSIPAGLGGSTVCKFCDSMICELFEFCVDYQRFNISRQTLFLLFSLFPNSCLEFGRQSAHRRSSWITVQ